ncbi:MAG: Rrf2 family transcriptional regulator [Candidatus Korobacteraceae bacterium]
MRTIAVHFIVLNMQLTRAADYAVRVMIHLASRPEGAIVSKSLLADASQAPESFLSKILQTLARAGLIQARRGVAGGFSLLPRGRRASLLDVVEIVDGPIALNVCLTSGRSCDRQPECAAHRVWLRAQSAMMAVLSEAKIMEMLPANGLHRTLLELDALSASGKSKSAQISSPARQPRKKKNTARPHPASAGARRTTASNKKIKK